MLTSGVYCLILYFGMTQNLVGCSKWVDDLTEYVAERSGCKQVTFITGGPHEESIKNPLVDELLVKVLGNVPTIRINFEQNFTVPLNLASGGANPWKALIDEFPTFFIIVIESGRNLPIPRAKKFIDAVTNMSGGQYSPKYLFISVVENPSKSLRGLLKYAWTKRLLDFTGLEIAQPTHSTTIESRVYSLIIHQWNPFKKEYTRRHWTADASYLFPQKTDNLWGYPLFIGVLDQPSEISVQADPSLQLLHALVQRLNCSVKYVQLTSLISTVHYDNLYSEMQSNNVDLVPVLTPYSSSHETKDDQTRVIRTDGIYFVVPVLTKSELRVSTNFFAGFLLTSGIIFTFWTTMRLLRIFSYPWRVELIARLIFGMSVSSQPRRNVDRIVFTCLLAICAFYSSTLYNSITDITWETSSEIEFETFEDLANSELVFKGHPVYLELASDALGGPSAVSQNRFIEELDVFDCVRNLIKFKNVSCLMTKSVALVVMMSLNHEGPRTVKLAKPCLVTRNFGFPMGKRSPFRATIDKLILRFQSIGLIEQLYYEFDRELERKRNALDKKVSDDENTLEKRLIVVSVVGYSISLIVLLGEIISRRISLYMKSKRRPPPRPPFPFLN